MRQVDTIDIGKGIKYAKVASRLAAFHEDNNECQIETSCEFKEGFALFSAKVMTKKGTFTGHSLAKVVGGDKKAFEKQETIAVGRALAFAGYLSSGDIASQEEMVDYGEPEGMTLEKLNGLKLRWASVYKAELKNEDQAGKRQLFTAFVHQTLGDDNVPSDVNKWETWDIEHLNACLAALTKDNE